MDLTSKFIIVGDLLKYLKQFGLILLVSFIGELMNMFIPLPVPASIWGLVIMYLCLHFKVIKLDDVHDTAKLMIEIMPVMFVPAAVGLIESWGDIKSNILVYFVITLISTVAVMAVSGCVTQLVIRTERKKKGNE